MDKQRCSWVGSSPQMIAYHDTEWGVPCRNDAKLFEFLVLDTFQAGLSWQGILSKREGLRRAFADFDPAKIAIFNEKNVERLLQDSAIIRNRAKIRGAITNAQCYLKLTAEQSFSDYLWSFVKGKTIVNTFVTGSEIPVHTPLAEAVSSDMKRRGFAFIGPTTTYAFMQGVGMVNDHLVSCFRYQEVKRP